MKVNVIGLGYIGLPTALTFANHGIEVVGVDVSETVVQSLQAGQAPIEEPDIDRYLAQALAKKTFKAQLVPEKADVFIIAVPTPNIADQFGSCDLSYVKAAMAAILPYLEQGNTVIVESTIQPRTMEDIVGPFLKKQVIPLEKNSICCIAQSEFYQGKFLKS